MVSNQWLFLCKSSWFRFFNHAFVWNVYISYSSKKEAFSFKNLPAAHCEFLVFFAAKSWRRKANFPLERADNTLMVPLLLVTAAASSTVSGSSGMEGEGSGRVNRNSLSMRIIWLKLGRMFGSSTQHDCMMNAKSGDMSSGILHFTSFFLFPFYCMRCILGGQSI